MGLFGEVKCGRCDRRYSAIRSRCPYCGARKRRSGKSSGGGDNRWQIVFGIILLAVIVVAVAVLIFKNIQEGGAGKPNTTPTPSIQATASPKASATPSPTGGLPAVTPPPTAKITSMALSREDFTLSTIGETWLLTATVTPTGATTNVTWSSLDPNVATVSADGRVTAVANGTTTITAEAGGVKASCIVRINAAGAPAASNSSGTGSVSLSHTDVTLNATTNESFTLKVNGSTATPTYSGGSTSVATVDANGVVKAVGVGDTAIYVTVGDTKLECLVRVIKK